MMPTGGGGSANKIIVHVDRDLAELIPGFMDNRRNDIAAMRAALEQGDHETVRSLAHCLKGCGMGYGFDAITEIGAALEQAANAKNRREIERWLDWLAQYLTRVEIVYGDPSDAK
jgi:HPt (histidine-containing phosphotransfer) domain-containing protein